MSSENEDRLLSAHPVESKHDSQRQSKISYTRDFLLSLSELDICKKLPSGFDSSILSDFSDASHSVSEWQRIPGNSSLQSFRRGEYGSSPPSRGDSSNYSRGGRWDVRSSGSNDRDSDSLSDKDSESGRRYGNQSRRSWQNPEHDGLLGSGAFPRPSGHAAGNLDTKARGNSHSQLNRSSEPYHPPRPYKAIPHSRRETTDSFNDETFGSVECSSQDRAEEEKKRRASFELMRKEQHKAFQEKQKQFPDKHKETLDPDITALLGDSEDGKRLWNKNNRSEEHVVPLASQKDSKESFLPTQTPASRPLVPPGFMSTILEKNLGTKPVIPFPTSEVGNIGFEADISHAKGNLVENGTHDNQEEEKLSPPHMDFSEKRYETKSVSLPFIDESEKIVMSSSAVEVSDNLLGGLNSSYKTSNLSEACDEEEDGKVKDFDAEKATEHKIVDTASQDHSSSILEKLFGGAFAVNSGGSSSLIEHCDVKADDSWSPKPFQSSKFARWFLEEEKKPGDDLSSGRPRDLLSLIVSGETDGSQMVDEKVTEHISSIFPFESNELASRFKTSTATSATVSICEPLYHYNKPDATSGVLTCEDLEQSIMSEINDNSSNLQHSECGLSVSDMKAEQPKAGVDDCASQHLLSLLQKGTAQKEVSPSLSLDVGSSDKLHFNEMGFVNAAPNSFERSAEKIQNSEKSPTLETLFGTTFMKELHSVEAPLSVQRGSIGGAASIDVPEPHGLPFPVANDSVFSSTLNEYGSHSTGHEGSFRAVHGTQQTKSGKVDGQWLSFGDVQTEAGPRFSAGDGFEDTADGAVEFQLPEEESLITVGDPVIPQNSMFMGHAIKSELSSSNIPIDIADKLAALNAVLKNERSMVRGLEGSPFLRGPYDPIDPEIPYQNLHGRPSSPQFPHPQMNHGRSLYHSLDSHHPHMNSQIKLMGPESIIHHDPPSHHHFPAMFRPPFQHVHPGPARFDHPAHHSVLQQMHVPGNFPPPHLLQGLQRGTSLPSQPFNHVGGFVPELNPVQNFSLGHQQRTYGSGLGMPIPAHGVVGGGGSNHPEALERLIEMELRANSKQIQHPIAPASHIPGTYGHELDMGFRYR